MSDPRDTLTWAEAVRAMLAGKWITFNDGIFRWTEQCGNLIGRRSDDADESSVEPLLLWSTRPDARFRIATRKVKKMKWQVVRRFDTQEEAEAFSDNLSFTRTGPKFAVESVEVEEEVEL
jgi:hypothetical protein